MKNYTLNAKDERMFILSYYIVKEENEKKIIVKFAKENEYLSIPYTIEIEKKILLLMKKQVLNAKKSKKELKKINISDIVKGIIYIIFSITMLILVLPQCIISPSIFKILFIIMLMPIYVNGKKALIKALKIIINLEDLQKNVIYIENEDILNEIDKSVLLKKVSNQTIETFKSNNKRLTINDIDKISLKDLNVMIENAINYKAVKDIFEVDLNQQVNERVRNR